jgi:hypothetical protein
MHLRLFRASESRNSLCKYSGMNSRNVVIYPWHQFDLINGGTLTSLSRVRTWLVWILNSVVGLLEYGKRPEWAASFLALLKGKAFLKEVFKGVYRMRYSYESMCVHPQLRKDRRQLLCCVILYKGVERAKTKRDGEYADDPLTLPPSLIMPSCCMGGRHQFVGQIG